MTRSRKRALARSVAIGVILGGTVSSMLITVVAHQQGELSTGWALAYVVQSAVLAFAAWCVCYVSRLADWQVAYWRDAYLGASGLYRTAAGLLAERRSLAADVARAVAHGLTLEERARLVAEAMRTEAEAPAKGDGR